ncbi:hypothetical protein QBC41DRAFT_330686 [Cercophora samala]|uniref:Uncharacterized protein n=1 Tax=Cercophora samala TaxID=330535 RepID=A0AA39YYH0_9PEZI|nr:hypothetical protein QBC41DRAFT_330686 [Cercophora samala]
MESSGDMKEWGENVKARVHGVLTSKAGGMFRWVQCQLDALEFCTSSEEIDEVLSSLPQDLPATHERILARLQRRSFKNIRLILLALAFSRQDLTVGDLLDILRIDPIGSRRFRNLGIYWNRLPTACSSLVSISQHLPLPRSAEAHIYDWPISRSRNTWYQRKSNLEEPACSH